MRTCVWLLLALVATGYTACQLPSAPVQHAPQATGGWRRTADGWERRTVWAPPPPRFTPEIHPGTVSALATIGTLIAMLSLAPAPAKLRAKPAGWHVSRFSVADRRRPIIERRRAVR